MGSARAPKAGPPPATATVRSAAPEQQPTQSGFLGRHRRAAITVLGAVLVAGLVYYVVPQIAAFGGVEGAVIGSFLDFGVNGSVAIADRRM